jgi:hypothetical protein
VKSFVHLCSVCGEQKSSGEVWFLVVENHAEDRLVILQWDDEVSYRRGMHRACCPAHVEELVIHWMASGSLDCPFAIAEERLEHRPGQCLPIVLETDTRGARRIGELSVHRESVDRALRDCPESLQIILDELSDTLKREADDNGRLESSSALGAGSLV